MLAPTSGTPLDCVERYSTPMDKKAMPAWSQTFTFFDGEWLEGNHPIVGPRTHAFWLGTSVFDGARAFEGVTPDLDKHCARLNRSANTMFLKPTMSVEAMLDLTREGMKKFKPDAELYIRPMYWAEQGSSWSAVPPDPEFDALLPVPLRGASDAALRRIDHPIALRQAARRHHADRRQGGLPLSQQRARFV